MGVALTGCGGNGSDGLTLVNETPDMVKILVSPDLAGGVSAWLGEAERRAQEHCAQYGGEARYIGRTPSPRPGWPSVVTFACE